MIKSTDSYHIIHKKEVLTNLKEILAFLRRYGQLVKAGDDLFVKSSSDGEPSQDPEIP